jgi:hypothetical protein
MATHKGGHRPAGGLHSNKTIHKPQPKVEPKARTVNVEATSQLGVKVAFEKPMLMRGAGYVPPQGPTNNLISGPGAGRTVYKSGSEHGLVKNPQPLEPGRSLFEGPKVKLGS